MQTTVNAYMEPNALYSEVKVSRCTEEASKCLNNYKLPQLCLSDDKVWNETFFKTVL